MKSDLSIDVLNLHKRLGTTCALTGATLRFEAGGLYGLIGPDGAGKTTLFRTLVGLLHPDQGSVTYRDKNNVIPFAVARAGVAYMPQQQSLYPDLSIDEHLHFFRDLHQISQGDFESRRARLLHLTRLEKFTDRPAGKLSGGMYKKLGLMCALLPTPSVLLLDEPTNGVDPISRREFWELIHELRSEGVLTIIATAYMDEAERCAEVYLMEKGQVLLSGPPRRILESQNAANFSELFIRRAGAGE
ncbi:MAG: ABC transporter ATP-binding protein [Elusimicrobia bacterium]|nr:ABC transporter ATP-binding protein [Elusimicrobiota bacterium]